MFNFILKHRKIVTALLILVGIILTGLLFLLTPNCTNGTEMPWVEKLYYCVQIVAGFYVVVGAVIAVWQYYISSKSETIKNQTEKVSQAVEIAGYYKDNIIPRISYINYIFRSVHAIDIIKKIDVASMKDFDKEELYGLISQEDIDRLKSLIENEDFIEAVREANIIYSVSAEGLFSFDDEDCKYGDYDFQLKIAQNCMMSQMTALLNNLEYFAMFFSHNIADETVVYQSLHHSYFRVVETMYYYISNHNEDVNHKFFVNLIHLYHTWKKKAEEKQKKAKVAEDELKKIKQPSLGTVSENFSDL